jgi:steroid delta-isomerase-like uncharacterized protein
VVNVNVKLLQDYVTAWNTHDVDKIVAFYAEDYVYDDTNYGVNKLSRQELIRTVNDTFHWYENQNKKVQDIFGAKSRWCMKWEWSGKDTHFNKTLHSRGITLFQISNGKIRRESCYQDTDHIVNWAWENILLFEGILEEEHFECPKQRAIVDKVERILWRLEYTGPK